MKANVYSVYDEKSKIYLEPFILVNDGTALRQFGDWTVNPKTSIYKHPGDYKLYKLGTFDDNAGTMNCEKPVFLAHALDFVEVTVEKVKDEKGCAVC